MSTRNMGYSRQGFLKTTGAGSFTLAAPSLLMPAISRGHSRPVIAIAPTLFHWDDHEVVNNWSAAKDLTNNERYTEKSVGLLSSRASRAFHEMTLIRHTPDEPGRVYRNVPYGPMLDVFFLDLRSYRSPNGDGMESVMAPDARVLGTEQLRWLKRELAASQATWKVIASDMPIGQIVWANSKEKRGMESVSK